MKKLNYLSLIMAAVLSVQLLPIFPNKAAAEPDIATLQNITITSASGTIHVGNTEQFTATANFSDGSTQDVTADATWSTGDASVATISVSGLATGHAEGSTPVAATYNGFNESATLTVEAIPTDFASNVIIEYRDVSELYYWSSFLMRNGKYTDNSPVRSAVQGLSQLIFDSATGELTNPTTAFNTSGDLIVSYDWSNNIADFNTRVAALSLSDKNVLYSPYNIPAGELIKFTINQSLLKPVDVYPKVPTGNKTYTAPTITGYKVANPNGGNVTLHTDEQINIKFNYELDSFIYGTVRDENAVPIANATVNIDGTTYTTDANGYYEVHLPMNDAWNLDNQIFAVKTGYIQSGTDSFALVPESVGTPWLHKDFVLEEVAPSLQSVTVTPATATIQVGDSQQYTATATFSDGSTQDITTIASWTLSNAVKADVNPMGRVTGNESGTTDVTVAWNGLDATASLTIAAPTPTPSPTPISEPTAEPIPTPVPTPEATPTPVPVVEPSPVILTSIKLTPDQVTVKVGEQTTFKAIAFYSDNSTQDITKQGIWEVSEPIAHISNGIAIGDVAGSTNIKIHWQGKTAVAHLIVEEQNVQTPSDKPDTDKPNLPVDPVKPVVSVTPEKPVPVKVDEESPIEDKAIVYGKIHGVVKDSDGNPMPGVRVELHSVVQTTITNEKGEYSFDKVELGEHELILMDADSLEKIGKISILVDNLEWSHEKSAISLKLTEEMPELSVDVIVTPNNAPVVPTPPTTEDKPTPTDEQNDQNSILIILGSLLLATAVFAAFWLRRRNVFIYETQHIAGHRKQLLLKKIRVKPAQVTVIDVSDILSNQMLLVVVHKRLVNKLLYKRIEIIAGERTFSVVVTEEDLNSDLKREIF